MHKAEWSPYSNATDGDTTATPRWVKVFGIITVVLGRAVIREAEA